MNRTRERKKKKTWQKTCPFLHDNREDDSEKTSSILGSIMYKFALKRKRNKKELKSHLPFRY